MRDRVSAALPMAVTDRQLRAAASMIGAIGQGRWEDVAHSCARMAACGAVIAPEMAAVLIRFAEGLRAAAAEREGPPYADLRPEPVDRHG